MFLDSGFHGQFLLNFFEHSALVEHGFFFIFRQFLVIFDEFSSGVRFKATAENGLKLGGNEETSCSMDANATSRFFLASG